MSQLVSRILLAIFVFPLGSVLYMVLFFCIEEGGRSYGYNSYQDREMAALIFSGATTWIVVAVYWWLLWRSSVKWTGKRLGGTLAVAALTMLAGAAVGFVVGAVQGRSNLSFAIFVGSVVTILLWLIATIFVWRENTAERASRLTGVTNAIACPTCGYNMTGLTEARCPECGSKFTLDELIALQPARVVEME